MSETDIRPKCRACGAPIVWAFTEKGRRIPLDSEPSENGNVVMLYDATTGVAHAKVYSNPVQASHARRSFAQAVCSRRYPVDGVYMPHHATCPNWKKGTK